MENGKHMMKKSEMGKMMKHSGKDMPMKKKMMKGKGKKK